MSKIPRFKHIYVPIILMETSVFPFALMLLILKSVTLTSSTPTLDSTTDHDALLVFKTAITADPIGVLSSN